MANNMIQNAAAATSQAVAKKKAPQSIQDYIEVMKPAIAAALPSVMTPERFTRITLSALSANPKLKECTPQSFLGAMMTAAQLGLEPNTPLGQAYLIPFRNHGRMECQFQIGYKGLIDLAYRSGVISIVQGNAVMENDKFDYELGLNPTLRHVPARTNRGNPVYYYAMFKTKDDGYGFWVMSYDEILAHAKKYSKSFGNGPWQTNFEEMALKTVTKKALKFAPMKSDFARGVAQDETTKVDISADMADIPDVTEYIDVDAETGEVIPQEATGNA